MSKEEILTKGVDLLGKLFKIVSEKPIVGLTMVGTFCLFLFYITSFVESQSKKFLVYLALVLMVIFVIISFGAMGIHVKLPLNDLLLELSNSLSP